MDGVTLIFGIGTLLFLVLYTAFSLDEKHFLLKVLLVAVVFFSFVLIPKAAIDNQDYCEIVVSGANISTANYTAYEYERECFENDNTTTSMFFKGAIWFGRFIAAYLVIFIIWFYWGEVIGKKFQKLLTRGGK